MPTGRGFGGHPATVHVRGPEDVLIHGFGRFKNTITDLDAWYEHQARDMAAYLGIIPAG